jgi:hypothetical protein
MAGRIVLARSVCRRRDSGRRLFQLMSHHEQTCGMKNATAVRGGFTDTDWVALGV